MNTSSFRGSPTGGILEATLQSLPGDTIIVDQPYLRIPHGSITLTKPGLTYQFLGTIDFTGNTDNGLYWTVPGIKLIGIAGLPTFTGTDYTTLLMGVGADDCILDTLTIIKYNQKAQSGASAIFPMSDGKSPLHRLHITNCRTCDGNGHGLNIGGVEGGMIENSTFELTHGLSAEGIAILGSDLFLSDLVISHSLTTGVIIWGVKSWPMHNINLSRLIIKDSSQAVLPSPLGISQSGSNAAIEVNLQDGQVSGLSITDCMIYDDQPTPTQDHFLKICNDSMGGKLISPYVQSNRHWGNINDTTPVSVTLGNPTTELINPQIQST